MKLTIAPIAVAVVLAGCSQAPPPPPPDTRADDAKAIRAVEVAWNQAWASRDLDKIASYWSDDTTVMIPDMPIMKGNAAVKASLKDMVADPNPSLRIEASAAQA